MVGLWNRQKEKIAPWDFYPANLSEFPCWTSSHSLLSYIYVSCSFLPSFVPAFHRHSRHILYRGWRSIRNKNWLRRSPFFYSRAKATWKEAREGLFASNRTGIPAVKKRQCHRNSHIGIGEEKKYIPVKFLWFLIVLYIYIILLIYVVVIKRQHENCGVVNLKVFFMKKLWQLVWKAAEEGFFPTKKHKDLPFRWEF